MIKPDAHKPEHEAGGARVFGVVFFLVLLGIFAAAVTVLAHSPAGKPQSLAAPRVQSDDGSQDVADLHAREELLLDNYSWLGQSQDQSQGKVRIPIERAMELIAQRGLPVAPAVEQAPLMTGDQKPAVAVPLTNGFARTGYEPDQAANPN